jgi:hypothetical protein
VSCTERERERGRERERESLFGTILDAFAHGATGGALPASACMDVRRRIQGLLIAKLTPWVEEDNGLGRRRSFSQLHGGARGV